MSASQTRRGFLMTSLTGVLGWRALSFGTSLRVHALLPRGREDLANGVLFGAEEARRTAALVASSIELERHQAPDDLPANPEGVLRAVVVGGDASMLRAVVSRVRSAFPVVNAGATDDALRAELCDDAVFHVAPNDAMLDRAVREPGGGAGARVAAWDPTLFRYGAEQLNDRYRARFPGTRGMPGDAWCGWMAMKVLADAALRSRARTNAELIAWMSSPRARFDGHKGVALVFDARRQLRQPLYVASTARRAPAEVADVDEDAEACA